MPCLIWGTPAEAIPPLGDYEHIKSRRAGGEYKVIGSYLHRLAELTESEKKRLTTWLVSQHRAGVAVPEITGDVLDAVARGRDMPFSERVNEAVSFFATQGKVNDLIIINNNHKALEDFLARTESKDAGEAQALLKMMAEMGLMNVPNPSQDTDRHDAPELPELLEMQDQGLVESRFVEIDEQSSVLKFRWKVQDE
jgi:hypothetical protein